MTQQEALMEVWEIAEEAGIDMTEITDIPAQAQADAVAFRLRGKLRDLRAEIARYEQAGLPVTPESLRVGV